MSEAGGKVTAIDGKGDARKELSVIASNGLSHEKLAEIVQL